MEGKMKLFSNVYEKTTSKKCEKNTLLANFGVQFQVP